MSCCSDDKKLNMNVKSGKCYNIIIEDDTAVNIEIGCNFGGSSTGLESKIYSAYFTLGEDDTPLDIVEFNLPEGARVIQVVLEIKMLRLGVDCEYEEPSINLLQGIAVYPNQTLFLLYQLS